MKTTFYLSLVVLAAATTSCNIGTGESVYGDGDVVSEERVVGDFEKLKVSSGIDVFIKQGPAESLVLEADENLLEIIKTEVVDNTLKIYSSKNIRRARAKQVYLEFEDLNSIRVSSSGDVRGQNTLQAENLDINLSSAGDLELDIEVDRLECDISSAGDARLKGTANVLDVNLSSAGDLHAYELVARRAKVNSSSAGDARIYVTEELEARSSSAGSICYKGGAEIVDVKATSAGSIVRK